MAVGENVCAFLFSSEVHKLSYSRTLCERVDTCCEATGMRKQVRATRHT